MKISFSFIIPVFNRPNEIEELLRSITDLDYEGEFEVVIVEDGSEFSSEAVVASFRDKIDISYYKKTNTGPGDSRNFGMKKAWGNYFLILDSDVLLPRDYLKEAEKYLKNDFVHCFGGPDAAHHGFSAVQKAINYAMTSFLTTGGVRGGKKMLSKFQPRSFNMGLSKRAFEETQGFGRIHPGEDPDLALRLQKEGFRTIFLERVVVYHKRRLDWHKFRHQLYHFGMVRPILNMWHPESTKLTYWFPTCFSLGLLMAVISAILGWGLPLYLFLFYFLVLFFHSLVLNKDLRVAFLSLRAAVTQFFAYSLGFCYSTYYITLRKKNPEQKFPKLFFKDV